MAISTSITRTVSDEEPEGFGAVVIERKSIDGRPGIEIRQDTDRVYLTTEHAAAVHAALGLTLAEAIEQPA